MVVLPGAARTLMVMLVVAGSLLVPASARALETGTVAGAAGQSGVTVTVYPADSSEPAAAVVTDTDGSFSIAGLAPGDYLVELTKKGYATRWHGGEGAEGESRSSGQVLSVSAGEVADIGEVPLSKGGLIRGTVRVAGVPTGSMHVYVLKLVDGEWVRESTSYASTSATTGFTYQLSTLRPVKLYTLAGPRSSRQFRYYYGDAYHERTAAELVVASGETVAGIDLDSPATATVSGRLTNSHGGPLSGSAKVLVRDHGQIVPLTLSSGLGISSSYFSGFTTVVPADTEVTVSGSSLSFEDRFLGDAAQPEDAIFRTVLPGGTLSGLSVALPGGQAYRFRVTQGVWTGNGRLGVPGLDVTAWWGEQVMARGVTDDLGYVSLRGFYSVNTPMVEISLTGPGLGTVWLAGLGGETTTSRTGASEYIIHSGTNGRDLGEHIVRYEERLSAATALEIVNDVAGKPVTLRLPEWSGTPDSVTVSVQDYWETVTLTEDLSGVVELPWWYDSWDGGVVVHVVAHKAGYESAVAAIGVTRQRFAATTRPVLTGQARPGGTLAFSPAEFNAVLDEVRSSWRGGAATDPSPTGTYQVTRADVGRTITLVQEATHGTAFATSASTPVRVKAKSALRVTTRALGKRTRIAITLRTPGAPTPGGKVRLTANGKVLRTLAVTGAPRSAAWTGKLAPRVKKVVVSYTGSGLATAVSRVASVPRR